MDLKKMTAADVLTMAMAAPALAQDPAPRSPSVHHQRAERVSPHGSGFWPADVAAGVVGGAIGTAGAIATAPFRGAYAYNDPYYDRRITARTFRGSFADPERGSEAMHLC
jgi:hypothetical protein